LSLIIGAVLGLSQSRIKRLFAYSTISHIGFILLALCVNTIESNKAFMFYLMQYTLTNINLFIILLTMGYNLYLYTKFDSINLKDKNNSPIQLINQIKGYFYINPILTLSLTIVMLSFIGLPPLVGFFAKQMVLLSALDNGFVFIVLISILISVISAVYYLFIVKTTIFEKNEYISVNININIILSSILTVIISILTLLIISFIFTPNESLYLFNILSIISFSNI
jgi:NADH-ubiquinone oxidoreductase chain 2